MKVEKCEEFPSDTNMNGVFGQNPVLSNVDVFLSLAGSYHKHSNVIQKVEGYTLKSAFGTLLDENFRLQSHILDIFTFFSTIHLIFYPC